MGVSFLFKPTFSGTQPGSQTRAWYAHNLSRRSVECANLHKTLQVLGGFTHQCHVLTFTPSWVLNVGSM